MTLAITTLLTLMLVLALLAGCRSAPDSPSPGYLYTDDASAAFIQWTKVDRRVSGLITEFEWKSGREHHSNTLFFDGVLDGESVTLTFRRFDDSPIRNGQPVTGRLKGDSLTLFLAGGTQEYRRATSKDYADAIGALATMRVKRTDR